MNRTWPNTWEWLKKKAKSESFIKTKHQKTLTRKLSALQSILWCFDIHTTNVHFVFSKSITNLPTYYSIIHSSSPIQSPSISLYHSSSMLPFKEINIRSSLVNFSCRLWLNVSSFLHFYISTLLGIANCQLTQPQQTMHTFPCALRWFHISSHWHLLYRGRVTRSPLCLIWLLG
jgi:hypothetical protein